MKKILSLSLLAIVTATLAGCPSFDRTTFNTLAVSNSALKTAQADYETGALPHDTCVYDLITKAKQAQGVAESAFLEYYQAEEAHKDVILLQQAVVNDLDTLAPFISSIKAAYNSPVACGTTTNTTSTRSAN